MARASRPGGRDLGGWPAGPKIRAYQGAGWQGGGTAEGWPPDRVIGHGRLAVGVH